MINKKLNNKGMTLVDTIIGVCLLSLCAIMLAVGFTTCVSLINEANQFKTQSARVSSGVEVGNLSLVNEYGKTTASEGSVVFDKDSGVSVAGKFYQGEDDKTGVNYSVFVPNTLEKLQADKVKK